MSRLSNFLLGDWLRFANDHWGDSYKQASRITGYDVNTLYKLVSVASKVDVFLRRKNLTWSHHALVAAFDREQQGYWLEQAEDHKWTVEDMRIELRSAQRARSGEADRALSATPTAASAARVGGGDASGAAECRELRVTETIICPKCGEHLVAPNGKDER
jgi:hypothetical protein